MEEETPGTSDRSRTPSPLKGTSASTYGTHFSPQGRPMSTTAKPKRATSPRDSPVRSSIRSTKTGTRSSTSPVGDKSRSRIPKSQSSPSGLKSHTKPGKSSKVLPGLVPAVLVTESDDLTATASAEELSNTDFSSPRRAGHEASSQIPSGKGISFHYEHGYGRGEGDSVGGDGGGQLDSGIGPDARKRAVPDGDGWSEPAAKQALAGRNLAGMAGGGGSQARMQMQDDSLVSGPPTPAVASSSRQLYDTGSPQLSRRGLSNSMSDSKIGMSSLSDVPSGSEYGGSRAVSPRSASLISSSGAAIVKAERDVLERQMSRARAQIAELQAEKKVLLNKLAKVPATVESLENQLRSANTALDKGKQEHSLSLAQRERQVNADKEWEVDEAHRQKREVERERDTLCAEIEALEASLEVTRKEVAAARQEVTSEEKRKRRTFEGEVSALKNELQVVKGLLRDNEEARKREQLAVESKTAELNRALRDNADLSREVTELKANPRITDDIGREVDVGKLQQELKVARKMVSSMQEERVTAMADVEEAHIRSTLDMQVAHKQELRKVRSESDRLQAQIGKHEDNIHKLTVDLNESKLSHDPKMEEIERSVSPSGGKGKSRHGSAMQYSFGRWTAHRADSRKHAEEMRLIIEALEHEGFGPKEATADEVIRHMWWKKEQTAEQLTEADTALKSMPGGDPRQAIEKWREEKEDLVRQLQVARDATATKIQEMQVSEGTTKKEIQRLVLDKQQSVSAADMSKRQLSTVQQEVLELKQRISTLQGSLVDAEKSVVAEKGDVQSALVQIRKLQGDIEEERRATDLLRAEMKTLQTEIAQKDKALATAARDREATVEKLGEAGSTVEHNAQQLAVAKTKIQHLEGELGLYRQQVNVAQSARDSLQAQLDESKARNQVAQSGIEREQQQVATLKSEVAVLEEHFATLRHDLEKEKAHGDELNVDLESSRAAIAALERSVQTLETENNMLRSELGEKSLELGKSSSAHRSVAHQLGTLREDLAEAQSRSQQLNMELGHVKAQFEVAQSTISRQEVEKENLQASLGDAKVSAQDTGVHVEHMKQEEQVIKTELSARRHELELAKAESKRLSEQAEASREHLRVEQRTLGEKQHHLRQAEAALLEEQERSKQFESSNNRVSNQLEMTIRTLDSEKERSAEWKKEAEKYQTYCSQLQVDLAKVQQQCDALGKELDTSVQRAKAENEQMMARIQQLQQAKTQLDGDVATSLSTIEMGNSERITLQQKLERVQTLFEEEKVLRTGDETSNEFLMQQKRNEIDDYKHRLDVLQAHFDALKAENEGLQTQASEDAAGQEQELREVLGRLQTEALKARQIHQSQVDVLSGNETKAQARCQQLCEELEAAEKQRNAVSSNLAFSKNNARELFEEKTILERQLEETRHELDSSRDEQMQFVQQSGRQQSEHTDQLRSLANQHQETLKELSAAHQVSQFMAQENSKLQQQIDLLRGSLDEMRAMSDKMRARHANEMEDLNVKLQSSTLSEAKAHGDVQQLRREHEAQLAALRSKTSALDGDVARLSTNNRLLETECSSLKNRLGMASEDLEASMEANSALNKSLLMEKESQARLEASLKDEIARQQNVTYGLSQQLVNTESAKSALQQNYDDVKAKLEFATRNLQDMQDQTGEQRALVEALEDEKRQIDMANARLEGELAALKDALDDERREGDSLRQRAKAISQELDQRQEESLESQKRFNSLLGSLQADFAKDKTSLTDERNTLQEHVDSLSADLDAVRRQAQQRDVELCHAQESLAESAKKAANTMTSLESEMNLRGTLQQQAARLEEEKRLGESRIDNLEQKLRSGIEQREKLQAQMDAAHKSCRSLRDQLQQSRDASADSVSRLKHQSGEIERRLSEEVQQLNDQLAQSRSTLSQTKASLETVSDARDTIADELRSVGDRYAELQQQLNDENTARLVAEQDVQHLQYRLRDDQRLQAKSEKKLKQLQKTLAELEISTDGERREREMAEEEKEAVATSLHAEQTRCLSLQEQVESLQSQLIAASKRLEDEGKRADYKTKQAAQDSTSQRMQFQVENHKLQSALDDLNSQLDRQKDKLQRKEHEASTSSATRADAERDLKKMETSMAETRQKLSEKRDQEDRLTMRVAELEAEASLLRTQIDSLKRNEEDIKDYKKRLEGNSRAEMHRVLAEVSRHMEQQHVAHRNLEKMRTENEHVLKEEGQRKKSELLERLSSTQADLDQMQIKHKALKGEYEELRQLRKDDQRARRRLESRLDRVNDTLSQTHSTLGASSASYLPASPVRDMSTVRSPRAGTASLDNPLLSSTPRKLWK